MDIKKIFNKSGLSVKEFANSLYVSERTVWNWFSGKTIPRQRQKLIIKTYGDGELPTTKSEVDTE